jgi:peptidoglycan/xylan/chitin deacetylase (PgdA/CDA1 family)
MQSYGAPFPRLFRPPYGSLNEDTLSLLKRFKMLMVLWSVDTEDYRGAGASRIAAKTLRGARPGAIILMHDGGGTGPRP